MSAKVARFFRAEEWAVTEDTYQPELNEFFETIFWLGNGYMGVRGTPEEGYTGQGTTPHTYLASVYGKIRMFPDHHIARYMEKLTVMMEVANWFPLEIKLDGLRFDPREGLVTEYCRRLDMKNGTLSRSLVWHDRRKRATKLEFLRFASLDNRHLGALSCTVTPLNWSGEVDLTAALSAAHTDHQEETAKGAVHEDGACLCTAALETRFETASAMRLVTSCDGQACTPAYEFSAGDKTVARRLRAEVEKYHTLRLRKLVAVCSSRDPESGPPRERATTLVNAAFADGFDTLLQRHEAAWERVWHDHDVVIEGDPSAQQGIRYCVLSMFANYTGTDPRVNIPAKGLTGPGYGGLVWWDTETYMFPFFLYTDPAKARHLLLYRYLGLEGARRKAQVYGYKGAMYPWVTITGDECSGDWEYGMLEQHVSSAISHAVRRYLETTDDDEFLWAYGAEMVLEIARFWASRVTWSERREQYVINFVTGPDEYAVGINNNCYTNFMAKASLEYAAAVVQRMGTAVPDRWAALRDRLCVDAAEPERWRDIAGKIVIPFSAKLGIHEQDDSFLDREPFLLADVPEAERPVGRRWLWEKLMRSQAMKQADVVLLMFLQHEAFSDKVKKANYDFYEPRTTHESSLSPCIYSIMAAETGRDADAFDYYLRSARLDLDDVNGNAGQGQHTACVAGAWMCVVNGFAGLRQRHGMLTFRPHLPGNWKRLAFALTFRGRRLQVDLEPGSIRFGLTGEPLTVMVGKHKLDLAPGVPATAQAVRL